MDAYFSHWKELLGATKASSAYSCNQILKLVQDGNLSETKKKRILGLKKGSNFKMSHLHSCGDLMLHRMTEEEVLIYTRVVELQKKTVELRGQIRAKTKDLSEELNLVTKEAIILTNKQGKLRIKNK